MAYMSAIGLMLLPLHMLQIFYDILGEDPPLVAYLVAFDDVVLYKFKSFVLSYM